jgi:hypothetical protein
MLRSLRCIKTRKRPLVEQLGFGIATLRPIEKAEIVDACECFGMLPSEHSFAGSQHPLIERLGFRIAALRIMESG